MQFIHISLIVLEDFPRAPIPRKVDLFEFWLRFREADIYSVDSLIWIYWGLINIVRLNYFNPVTNETFCGVLQFMYAGWISLDLIEDGNSYTLMEKYFFSVVNMLK